MAFKSERGLKMHRYENPSTKDGKCKDRRERIRAKASTANNEDDTVVSGEIPVEE